MGGHRNNNRVKIVRKYDTMRLTRIRAALGPLQTCSHIAMPHRSAYCSPHCEVKRACFEYGEKFYTFSVPICQSGFDVLDFAAKTISLATGRRMVLPEHLPQRLWRETRSGQISPLRIELYERDEKCNSIVYGGDSLVIHLYAIRDILHEMTLRICTRCDRRSRLCRPFALTSLRSLLRLSQADVTKFSRLVGGVFVCRYCEKSLSEQAMLGIRPDPFLADIADAILHPQQEDRTPRRKRPPLHYVAPVADAPSRYTGADDPQLKLDIIARGRAIAQSLLERKDGGGASH